MDPIYRMLLEAAANGSPELTRGILLATVARLDDQLRDAAAEMAKPYDAVVIGDQALVDADAWRAVVEAVGDVVSPDDHVGIASVVAAACREFGCYSDSLVEIMEALGMGHDGDPTPEWMPEIVSAVKGAVAMADAQAETIAAVKRAMGAQYDPFGFGEIAEQVASLATAYEGTAALADARTREAAEATAAALDLGRRRDEAEARAEKAEAAADEVRGHARKIRALFGLSVDDPRDGMPTVDLVGDLMVEAAAAARDRDAFAEVLTRVRAALPDGDMAEDLGDAVQALADAALQTSAAPAFDLEAWLAEKSAWSLRTFGPGARSEGVCRHIESELAEIRRAPNDLSEWVDVVLLALDGAWRAGFGPAQVVSAMRAKQSLNAARSWSPEPAEDEPAVLHANPPVPETFPGRLKEPVRVKFADPKPPAGPTVDQRLGVLSRVADGEDDRAAIARAVGLPNGRFIQGILIAHRADLGRLRAAPPEGRGRILGEIRDRISKAVAA